MHGNVPLGSIERGRQAGKPFVVMMRAEWVPDDACGGHIGGCGLYCRRWQGCYPVGRRSHRSCGRETTAPVNGNGGNRHYQTKF